MNYKDRREDLSNIADALLWFSRCDVILTNGQEQLIGIGYKNDNKRKPYINRKFSYWALSYLIFQVSAIWKNPCIENKILVNALYDEIEFVGVRVPEKYLNVFETIYDKLPVFENKKDGVQFQELLREEISLQLGSFGHHLFKRIAMKNLREYYKNTEHPPVKLEYNLKEILINLAELNNLEFHENFNFTLNLQEYYLENPEHSENFLEYVSPLFWLMIFLTNDYIYVGNQFVLQYFEKKELPLVVNYIKKIVEKKTYYKKKIIERIKEMTISEQDYSSAIDSFKKILSENFSKNRIEYGYGFNTTILEAYLEKKEDNTVLENEKRKNRRRMYEIVITYKEFLKNPETFKRFIENPHIIDKWNFWCKERMYKQECFQKRDK